MPVDRSRDSHAFANMVEHMFLADLMHHMWVARGEVLEVAKAEVDSWGYDVVLATQAKTRYVQLKTSVPVEVSLRLVGKPGACVIATIPEESKAGIRLKYRFWQPKKDEPLAERDPSRRKVYRRGATERAERVQHRNVKSSEFTRASGLTIAELAALLFHARR